MITWECSVTCDAPGCAESLSESTWNSVGAARGQTLEKARRQGWVSVSPKSSSEVLHYCPKHVAQSKKWQ